MKSLSGMVAIVTGAAAGIGLAIAETYARDGAKVVLADVDAASGVAASNHIRSAGAEAIFVETDVADPDSCRRMVEAAIAKYGRLDIACNNAGISPEANATADYSLTGWQRVIETNLNGVFYCMKYQIAAMLSGGAGGAIVNIASVLGQVGFATAPAYTAAKHGVVGLTRSAALEYGPSGIRVNAVGPGVILTAMIEKHCQDPDVNEHFRSLHALGRLGKAQEVAELVSWLSSPSASFVTGSFHPVDGGYLAR